MLFNSGEPLLGALWFVIPLFIVNFMFLIIRKIDIRTGGKYNVTTWIVIFFFILGYFADYNKYQCFHYFSLDVAFITLAIFYSGYMIRKVNFMRYIHWIPAVLCLIMLIVICNNYGSISLALRYRNFNHPFVFLVGSFTGIYLNLYITRLSNRYKPTTKLFSFIGERSFSIMALQFVAFKAVNLFYVLYNKNPITYLAKFPYITSNNYWWFAYLCAGIMIPLGLVLIYDKVRTHCFIIRA